MNFEDSVPFIIIVDSDMWYVLEYFDHFVTASFAFWVAAAALSSVFFFSLKLRNGKKAQWKVYDQNFMEEYGNNITCQYIPLTILSLEPA